MNNIGDLPTKMVGSGTADLPSINFFQERNTGPYLDDDGKGNTSYTISKRGTKRLKVTDTGVDIIGNVTYTGNTIYSGDVEITGDLKVDGGDLAISSGGVTKFTVGVGAVNSSVPIHSFDGTSTLPGYSFIDDITMGLSRGGTGQLDVSVGGLKRFGWTTTAVTSTLPLVLPDGGVSGPSLSFGTDPALGLYHQTSPSILSVTAGSNNVMNFGTSSVSVSNTVPFICGSQSSSGTYTNSSQPFCLVSGNTSSTMSVGNAVTDVSIWNATVKTQGGCVLSSSKFLTAPSAGNYVVDATLAFSTVTGQRDCWFVVNNIDGPRYGSRDSTIAGSVSYGMNAIIPLAANDTVSIKAISVVTSTVGASNSSTLNYFGMYKLG